jgi:hypothetical protein
VVFLGGQMEYKALGASTFPRPWTARIRASPKITTALEYE